MTDTMTPAEVFPPGDYLRDELDARAWTIAQFAEIVGRPTQTISEILNGRKTITPETATEIGAALGTSAEVWLTLQNTFQLHHLRRDTGRLGPVQRRARLNDLAPVAALRKLGWVPAGGDLDATERAVCGLLRIKSPADEPTLPLAARRSNQLEAPTRSQLAWVGRVMQLAERRSVPAFNPEELASFAAGLGRQVRDPDQLGLVRQRLAEVGVILVCVPHVPGSKIDGGALRLADGTPTIGLSLRGRRFDGVVFTLAHEIAHVVLDHISDGATLDEDIGQDTTSLIESAANDQASAWLFPNGIPITSPVSETKVRDVAAALGVHPALVVGRLHWEERLAWRALRGLIPTVTDTLSFDTE